MSMIKCPECGKEISDSAKSCPNCGHPMKPPRSKIIIVVAIIMGAIALVVLASGIKDLLSARQAATEEASNPMLGNYYMGMSGYHVYVVRFNDDNTVEFVDSGLGRDQDERQKAYGTYSIDKSSVEITMSSGNTMNCIIHDGGKELTIEGETFSVVNKDEVSQKTMDCFD